jgi:hypothetical protein
MTNYTLFRIGTIGYVASTEKYCVDVAGGFFAPGSLLQIWNCQNSNPDQQWNYRGSMLVWAPMDGSGTPSSLDVNTSLIPVPHALPQGRTCAWMLLVGPMCLARA